MTDIIEKAIDEWGTDTERQANGTFADRDVRINKEQYQESQLGTTQWRLAVYVEGDKTPTKVDNEVDAAEADEEFERLVDMYDLTEQ